ncbi:MAG: hypothetical protein GTN74_15825 [Proteobacteria bacterium]|nr:hypothetical protein [Pseudomonadota bacterium]NIS72082.1 hypothetical protein [Pseudomonadota bacterium]
MSPLSNSSLSFALKDSLYPFSQGLAHRDGNLPTIQESFLEAGAVQCGFCTAGFIMRLYALFKRKSQAPEEVIQAELSKHLCRCTGHQAIWEASLLAQKRLNT